MEFPPHPKNTRTKRSFTHPGEANEIIAQRLKALDMTLQQYIESLILYDLRLEKPHLLTGDSVREGGEMLWSEWRGVAEDFGKADKNLNSYIEYKISQAAQKKKDEGSR